MTPGQLGVRLRKVRETHGWSQLAAGASCGASRIAIWKWETGRSFPSMMNFLRLCKEYKVDAGVVLTGEPKEFKKLIEHLTFIKTFW